MYKLYLDKSEDFICEVSIKNASLKNSIARLIAESDGISLVFNGQIKNGKCVVPVHRLKGLLDENTRGKMHLEMIVEDTYFKPWQSDFVVEEHTSVKVKVNEQKTESKKPIVEVKSIKNSPPKKKGINIFVPLTEISDLCKRFGIKKNNIRQRKSDLSQILKEYFKVNSEYKNHQREILNRIGMLLK